MFDSVSVAVHNGYVTLTGEIQFDNQRRPLLNAARGVEGVRTAVDQLQVKSRERKGKGMVGGGTSPGRVG